VEAVDDVLAMREALAEAQLAVQHGDVPVGAVVVREGRIVARAHNERELRGDPTAHAEILALRSAAEVVGNWRLGGCTLYVTLEPCVMCAGALQQSRIDRVVFAAADPKGGATGTLYNVAADPRLNHEVVVTHGVLATESSQLLSEFFARHRNSDR
jgi:tRNA(adenine34) deaminase